jgi:hypothetical protein
MPLDEFIITVFCWAMQGLEMGVTSRARPHSSRFE